MADNKDNKKNRSFMESAKYENFREFLKVNFYYCSLSSEQQEDYIENIHGTKYSEYKNYTEKFSDGKVAFAKFNKRKAFKYDITQFESDYNVFANSFQFKTITELETCINLYILCALANRRMTITEIVKNSGSDVDTKTINERIKTLYEFGYISKEGGKYFIEENRLYSMNEVLLYKLLNMVDFMKNLVFPEVLGYNLFTLIKSVYEERTGNEYNSPFQFKYSHLANILDDNVLWALIEAIENRQYISFTYEKKIKENIIPVIVFTENEYNRRYLFAVSKEPFRFYIFKLSKIYKLNTVGKKGDVKEKDFESFLELYNSEKKYSFSGKMDSSSKINTVSLKYKSGRKIKNQIKRDFYSVEFEKGNTAKVTIKNKKMIKPYLRANMGLIETTDKKLSEMIRSEIEEMKKNYGIIS